MSAGEVCVSTLFSGGSDGASSTLHPDSDESLLGGDEFLQSLGREVLELKNMPGVSIHKTLVADNPRIGPGQKYWEC